MAKKDILMSDFFLAINNPENLFLRYALIMAGLASIPFGIMGTFVTTKRIGYLAGAISHSVFGGIGLALFLQINWGIQWFTPLLGAIIAAVLAAVIVGLISIYGKERDDTIIGTVWAVGMASGLLFIDKTPGYFDITSYLFGDILLISTGDLVMIAVLDVVVVICSILFFNRFFAVCFDSEYSSLRGISATFFYMLLLILTALTVVLMVRIVGIVLVIALLTIPPAIASGYAKRLWQMMLFSTLLCMGVVWAGIGMSYELSLSTGPTIIVIAGVVYSLSLLMNRFFRKN